MSYKRYLENLAAETGLKPDEPSRCLYGVKSGFSVCLSPMTNPATLVFSVSRGGAPADCQEMRSFVKSCKALASCTPTNFKLLFSVKKPGFTSRGVKNKIIAALEEIPQYLRNNGFQNCCQNCGAAGETDVCIIGGMQALVCADCFGKLSMATDRANQTVMQKKENVVARTVGALLGSVIGAVVLVLLGQLGYVAALSGIIMAVCALKGYELLSGKLSGKGIIISCALILVMVYLGNQCDWAVSVASYYDVSFFDAFPAIPELISEEIIEASQYYGNLAMHYLFALLGAVPVIFATLKNRSLHGLTYRMSSGSGISEP